MCLAIIAILALAAGLTDLEIRPGKPLPSIPDSTQAIQNGPVNQGSGAAFMIIQAGYYFIWLLFLVFLIGLLLSPSARKRLLHDLIRIIPFMLLVLLLLWYVQNLGKNKALQESGLAQGVMDFGSRTPGPEVEFIPKSPSWVIWGVSLGIALLLVGLVLFSAWFIWRRRQRGEPLTRLAEEAQIALDSLEAGQDLKNVIVRCYFEMVKVINDARGIKRFSDMTPHEFQQRLEEKGLPREPLQELTSLFEEVRYGQKAAGKYEEQRAITSLTAILDYCRSG